MAYADYGYYSAVYFGNKIPAADYPYFADRASEYLDSLKCGDTDENRLQKACCACAEIMYMLQSDKQITAEKVGDYSVNYATNQTSVADELIKVATRYLDISPVRWV